MMLSICVIVYNHGKFIKACLDGIFSQKVSFDVEVIIADDCSPDNSREVINEYLENAVIPSNFHVKKCFHSQNLGMNGNWKWALELTTGDYLTAIEGDDYWDEPEKLNIQVSALESDHSYSSAANDIGIVDHLGREIIPGQLFTQRKFRETLSDQTFSIGDYLRKDCLFHTSSLVYRNFYKGKPLPDLVMTAMSLDQAIFILFNPYNKIWFSSRRMGGYRVHPGGITKSKGHTNLKKVTLNQIQMFTALKEYSNTGFSDDLQQKINKLKFEAWKIRMGLPFIKRYVQHAFKREK